jgi:succinoglycan biosynthesis protein ExoA
MPNEEHPPLGVSYVIPVLNEVAYIGTAIRTVLEQDYSGPTELILALGPSSDGTTELVQRLAEADARIVIVFNPFEWMPIPSWIRPTPAAPLRPSFALVPQMSAGS